MFNGYKVVAVTPAGRHRYLDILSKYILRDRHVIDEWRLWVNTCELSDIKWMKQTAKAHPNFVVMEDPEIPVEGIYSIHSFFRNCTDPKTIYIRFDDDILWVAPDAIENLLKTRLAHRDPFLVFANIINNSVCSYHHQVNGVIPSDRYKTSLDCLDPIAWGNGDFAIKVHQTFFDLYKQNKTYLFKFPDLKTYPRRFSINCLAFMGEDFAEFEGKVGREEEVWLTETKPTDLNRQNMIAGDALICHYAYYPQRPIVDRTNVVDLYARIAELSC